MNVLMLGGTGAMGTFLVDILLKKGCDVYVTSRSQKHSMTGGAIYLHGNAHDAQFFDYVLRFKAWDCIVDFMNYSTNEFSMRYSALLENTKQFVFISSARVYSELLLSDKNLDAELFLHIRKGVLG